MNILIAIERTLPVRGYGGTERMVWYLGKEYARMGHKVSFLVNPGSSCPFARVIPFQPGLSINKQIPEEVDFVHVIMELEELPEKPFLINIRGNTNEQREYHPNTSFLTRNHASRHNSTAWVYNGIDPEDYGSPALDQPRHYFHFLAKAAWRLKNLRGAIRVTRRSGNRLEVMGGHRFNIKMGARFTIDPRVRFHGMVGGEKKNQIMRSSAGLVFPVLWHEPFGIAIIESLYFGCPVFGTPYGSLPELVPGEAGFLSDSQSELAEAIKNADSYDRKKCHEYVMDNFTSSIMARNYLTLYERILNGENLNPSPPCHEAKTGPKFLPFFA